MTSHRATAPGITARSDLAGQREPGRRDDEPGGPPRPSTAWWHAMPGDASLAKLFRDVGERWEIEKIDRGAEWLAWRRDSTGLVSIIAARDVHALRFKIGQAEQENAGEQGEN